jgi:hypothetical protein
MENVHHMGQNAGILENPSIAVVFDAENIIQIEFLVLKNLLSVRVKQNSFLKKRKV